MRDVTIVFPLRSREVLLGLKKRGFGHDKWNGFGGKVEHETIREAAVRELEEESGLITEPNRLEQAGTIVFELPGLRFRAHVFTAPSFEGEPVETEEMRPKWYAFEKIPYARMWEDDRYWLPFVLAGRAIDARFVFEDRIVSMRIGMRNV